MRVVLVASALATGSAAFVGSPALQGRSVGRSAVGMTATAPELVDKKQSFDTSIDEIPKCPETMRNADSIDLQQAAASAPSRTLPLKLNGADVPAGMSETEFFASKREELLAQLTESGAIWFRGFETMKTKVPAARRVPPSLRLTV